MLVADVARGGNGSAPHATSVPAARISRLRLSIVLYDPCVVSIERRNRVKRPVSHAAGHLPIAVLLSGAVGQMDPPTIETEISSPAIIRSRTEV
jgi:hypothetical protein